MKKLKTWIAWIIFVFIFCIIYSKVGFYFRGLPRGGLTWTQIYNKLTSYTIFSLVSGTIIYVAYIQLKRGQTQKLINAEKRISNRQYYFSPVQCQYCRICGFANKEYPWGNDGKEPSYQICPCCGVQFGVYDITPEEILNKRNEWIKREKKRIEYHPKPANWSMEEQMKNIPEIEHKRELI